MQAGGRRLAAVRAGLPRGGGSGGARGPGGGIGSARSSSGAMHVPSTVLAVHNRVKTGMRPPFLLPRPTTTLPEAAAATAGGTHSRSPTPGRQAPCSLVCLAALAQVVQALRGRLALVAGQCLRPGPGAASGQQAGSGQWVACTRPGQRGPACNACTYTCACTSTSALPAQGRPHHVCTSCAALAGARRRPQTSSQPRSGLNAGQEGAHARRCCTALRTTTTTLEPAPCLLPPPHAHPPGAPCRPSCQAGTHARRCCKTAHTFMTCLNQLRAPPPVTHPPAAPCRP